MRARLADQQGGEGRGGARLATQPSAERGAVGFWSTKPPQLARASGLLEDESGGLEQRDNGQNALLHGVVPIILARGSQRKPRGPGALQSKGPSEPKAVARELIISSAPGQDPQSSKSRVFAFEKVG